MNELMHNFRKIAHALHHGAAENPFAALTEAELAQLSELLEKAAKPLPERHGRHEHHGHHHEGGFTGERPVDENGYCIACGKHCPPDHYRCDGKK